jgi:hypothetical protein
VLFVDLEPVHLARLYPNATSVDDAASQALAQGQATAEAGAALQAAQQDPGEVDESGNPLPPGGGQPGGGQPDGPTAPPSNLDVPLVSQSGSTLNCTMGNWNGEPTSYAYQWKLDDTDAGTNTANYEVQSGDAGKTATCIVTATNAKGSTAAPPSTGLVVE